MTTPPIIVKRTKSGTQVWVGQELLMHHCPTLSDGYLRKVRCYNRKGENAWRFESAHGSFYYNLDNIPDKRPAMYASSLPPREELLDLLREQPVDEGMASPNMLADARAFTTNEMGKYLPYYSSVYTRQQADNLATACAMLEWMVRYIDESGISIRPMDFFKESGDIIRQLDIKYLPATAYRNLKYKVVDVMGGTSSIVESVQLPRANNDYAALHREDNDVLGWIYALRASGANYTSAFIIRKVQAECLKTGKPAPSDRWIGEKMAERETQYLTGEARFGSGRYANPYKSSIPTATALFAGDCWEMDATRVNVLPHKSDGKQKYLTIIAVRDVHSGNTIGMSFDVSENRWSVVQALSNAVANTGYLPYEIRHDRFPGHNTEEVETLFDLLHHMGVKTTVTYKASGKQRLERWFGSMQHLALQESPYYYGEGIMSNRKTAHRSKEYMQLARKMATQDGWDFDRAVNETETKINSWLNTPYSQWSRKYKHIELSPVQMHEESEKPNITKINPEQHAFLFGLKKTLKIYNSGLIKTTINHEEFIYQIEDFDIIKRYESVICCYDVEDLSKVHLYAPSDTALKPYLGEAKEFDPVQLYGPNPEHGRLAKVRALYSEFERLKHEELSMKKVVGGDPIAIGWDFGADYTVIQPMTVTKDSAEAAESQVTNEHFGFDDDIINQL